MLKRGEKRPSVPGLANNITQSLNDDNFTAFTFLIYLDPITETEMTVTKQQALADWISGGYRQKFTTISPPDLFAWSLENTKTYDVCREMKALLDGGMSEAEVPEPMIAKLLKAWFLFSKQDCIDIKNGLKANIDRAEQAMADDKSKAAAKPAAADKEKEKKDKEKKIADDKPPAPAANTAVKKDAKGGKGKPAETTSAPVNTTSNAKAKNKLRDRVGAKEKIVAVGDEPVDGPDMYYYIKDFNSPGIISALREEFDVPIDSVFRVEHQVSGRKAEGSGSSNINANWQTLRNKSKESKDDAWKKTVWMTLPAPDFREGKEKEIFETLANRIYSIIEKKKIFNAFYRGNRITAIPQVDSQLADLRYYNYLCSMICCSHIKTVDIYLAFLLEALNRNLTNEDDPIKVNEAGEMTTGYLKQFFDQEISRIIMDNNITQSKSIQTSDSRLNSTAISEYNNVTGLEEYFCDALKSVDISYHDLIERIKQCYTTFKYSRFLELLPEYSSINLAHLLGESMKLKTEFHRNSIYKFDDESRTDKFLAQTALEDMLKSYLDTSLEEFTLDDWRWFGSLSPASLIEIRTKVGFSLFHDLYDPTTESLAGDTCNADNPNVVSYLMNDKLVDIKLDYSYLYPQNNSIIQVTKRTSAAFGNDTTTKIVWNDTTIVYAGENNSSSISHFTVNFFDHAVFSINGEEDNLSISFTDTEGNYFCLNPNGTISEYAYGASNSSKLGELTKAGERKYLSTGVVISNTSSGVTKALFPDGSLARLSNVSKEWCKVDRHGNEDGTPVKKVSTETFFPTQKIQICREDLVTITQEDNGVITTEHSCGTTIKSVINTSHTILQANRPTITFEYSGRQVIECKDEFTVERWFVDGKTTKIQINRAPMDIEILPCGKTKVKLTSFGYNKPIPEHQNIYDLNWRQGTMEFIDLKDYRYSVSADGQTKVFYLIFNRKVVVPEVPTDLPDILFGGRQLKNLLKKGGKVPLTGNMPRLLIVAPNDQEGMQMLRDSEMLAFFHNYRNRFTRTSEELSTDPNNLTLSMMTEFHIPKSDQKVIQYRQLTRMMQVESQDRQNLISEHTNFLERVKLRDDERPLSELGETPESLIPNHDRTGPFIFGKDKEATQLAIVLKHMEKEDLLRNPGSVMNLQQAKKIMQNPKGHSNSGHGFLSEQMSRNKKLKGSLGQKFHKYFDSPEGQLFNPPKMESILPSKENLFEVNSKINKIQATNETNSDTMKIANELSESQSNSVYTSSVPNIVATKSTNSENNLVPELKSSTLKVNSIKV
ncbi:hypothetical protein HDV02_000892 [Globomyces sp. JEL0801]|nr:hypothetical protein HDV02_000892 [Globomyces sp. JEL0801]